MSHFLKDARLITVMPHKDLGGLRQEPLECSDPYPLILDKSLEPGFYALQWRFLSAAGGPSFRLDLIKAEGADIVAPAHIMLRAHEYFSHGAVSFRIVNRTDNGPVLIKAISDLFNQQVDRDPVQVARKFTDHQTRAFNAKMNGWINFSGSDAEELLYRLKIKMAACFQEYTQNRPLNAEVIKLPPDYDPV